MKIRRAEILVAVAIVTSAAVMQIREHLLQHETPPASMQNMSAACGAMHEGLVPAGCEATGDNRQVDRAPLAPHDTPRIWV
ncbi:hypothetical protein NDK50_27770 [Paraburkholderia bryophila]|uniref:hypothetical protein n=1 Tax=Paraburkholderia bryophila TaxID=420952 RepID=UPI00234ACAA6|nr:hypothetical protein [Paraburkholderia bryophila]WCM24601.1 hypothetical protein NDK50_27770 [Paraburkholderia bryophila]